MRKNLLLVFLCSCLLARADFWIQKATYPGIGGSRPFSFAIGTKGYFGCGDHGTSSSDFWKYDQATNTWSQKASFGGGNRWSGACFVVGGKAYAGTGYGSNMMSDMWEYNPSTNTWMQVANFAPGKRQVSIGFSLDNFGYIACGRDSVNNFLTDMWQYDPTNNLWTQMANFPGISRSQPVAFALNGKGYVGTGFNQSLNGLSDFFSYDPGSNTWSAIASLPGTPRGDAAAFAIGNFGYVGTGQQLPGNSIVLNDFWRYDPVLNTWMQKATFSGTARDEAGYFSIGNKGYIGTGSQNGNLYFNDFWEYTPDTATSVSAFASNNFDFNIYPNPVKNKLSVSGHFLSGNEKITCFVLDIKGKKIIAESLQAKNNILRVEMDVSELIPGNYMLKLIIGDKIISKHFLKT